MRFSIITVCLNPGESLKYTLDSIINQTYKDFEVIIKDGGSTDGSLNALPDDSRFKVVSKSDKGIYDAMNEAVKEASGDYFIFMNCGDRFYDDDVLLKTDDLIGQKNAKPPCILYGDSAWKKADTVVKAASVITPKVCYLNIPCHQATFYSKDLFDERAYDLKYRIRADYEHFLYCFFERHAGFIYLDMPVCEYEGGGFSETAKNRREAHLEHKDIVKRYIPLKTRFLLKLRLILTLQAVREKLAKSKTFGSAYERVKRKFVR